MLSRPTLFLLLAMMVTLSGCTSDDTLLEQVKDNGKLVVVTRNSATTYYKGPFGDTGLEYDLTKRFADHLGVKLEIIIEENFSKMFKLLESGKADIAAANLSITDSRKKSLKFGPSYMDVVPQVVYRLRNNTKRPRKIKDLINSDLEVVANSAHAELLTKLKEEYPELEWQENSELDIDELLELVWSQFIDYTIADSTEVKLKQRFFPELAVAFDIGKPKPVAWAMATSIDDTLYNEVVTFFDKIRKNGVLKQLINKHYGHIRRFSYVGTQAFLRDVANKLPEYLNLFKLSAHANELDWRLLAAVGYQESHWNPKAVSPTGVKGIMMLTRNTAKYVGISDRENTIESIEGGAKYLRYMIPGKSPRAVVVIRTSGLM